MEAKGNSFVEVQKNLEGFITILTSAACEWFLIFLLLVDGLLSYLLTKFASYCNLQKPCIFCSRFEHVTGNDKPQLYQDLLCSNHISELSSWIAYQIYGKDDHNGMCEDCIFSSPSKDKFNPEKHKILVGKSEWDLGSSSVKKSMQKRGSAHCSVGVKPCSCCSRPYKPRENAPRLQRKSSGSKPNIPLPRFSSRSRAHRRDGSRKIRDKYSASVTPRHPGKVGPEPLSPGGYKPLKICSDTESVRRPGKVGRDPLSRKGHTKLKMSSDTDSAHRLGKFGWDPLSHVGYSELKISSDTTDSEIPFSDDDPGNSFIIGNDHEPKKEGLVGQCAPEIPFKLNLPKLPKHSKASHKQKPSFYVPFVQQDGSKASDVKSLGSIVAFENGLEYDEPSLQKASWKSAPSALAELFSLDVIPPPSSNVVEKNFTGTDDFPLAAINKNDDLLKSISARDGASANIDPNVNEPTVIQPNHTSETAASESAGLGEEGDSSGILKEQPTTKEPDRVDGELKPLDSQNSSALESNLSTNTISGVNGCEDEKQVTVASILNPKPMISKSASVESGLGSLDEGYVSEIDGESIVDRLKRQVDYYRKCLKELFNELDEERNAAEIAANQAMAMITKLQEEKAAIHMEALQYLRMMEEQAEFDVDALEKANDLLAEKEKEIQDLEAELEFSKLDVPDELTVENMLKKSSDLRSEIDTVETTVVPSVESDVEVTRSSVVTEVPETSKEGIFSETTLFEFEDEKLYISNCLKSLERKLSEISCNGTSSNMPKGERSRMHTDDGPNQEETPRKEKILLNGQAQAEENIVHGQENTHVSNSDSLDSEEKDESNSPGQKGLMDHTETELIVLENEISDLNDRLEALETDHDFLEHMVYSLQNGSEGLRFVQEIAQQLRELRQIGTAVRCQSGSLSSNRPSQDTFETLRPAPEHIPQASIREQSVA